MYGSGTLFKRIQDRALTSHDDLFGPLEKIALLCRLVVSCPSYSLPIGSQLSEGCGSQIREANQRQ
jgi:hypothetical protein